MLGLGPIAGQPDGDLAEQRGDRVLTIILDPAGRATAAARRTAHSVPTRLRSDELLLDASQELLTLGHSQAQGGQIREVVRSGDPHDLRAAFGARGPDAYQLHDPGHAVSAHRSTSRKVPSWTRTPNLAAVPFLVPLCAEQEVDRLAGAVDGPVQVALFPADPDVSLIDVPWPTAGAQVPAHRPQDHLGREAKAAERWGGGHGRCSRRGDDGSTLLPGHAAPLNATDPSAL